MDVRAEMPRETDWQVFLMQGRDAWGLAVFC
jgi:hypothetical protein